MTLLDESINNYKLVMYVKVISISQNDVTFIFYACNKSNIVVHFTKSRVLKPAR